MAASWPIGGPVAWSIGEQILSCQATFPLFVPATTSGVGAGASSIGGAS